MCDVVKNEVKEEEEENNQSTKRERKVFFNNDISRSIKSNV